MESSSTIKSPSSVASSASSSFIKTVTLNYISRDAVIEPATHVEIKGRSILHPNTRVTVLFEEEKPKTNHDDNDNNNNTNENINRDDNGPSKIASTNKRITSFVRMGRYCHVSAGTTITTPPHPLNQRELQQQQQQQQQQQEPSDTTKSTSVTATANSGSIPVVIGSHTIIEENCAIRAAAIGSFCWIGSNVQLMDRVIIKDACIIESGAVVPADTVIPPFTRVQNIDHHNDNLQGGNARVGAVSGSGVGWLELPPATVQAMQEKSVQMFQAFVSTQQQQQ